ncbi:SPOR domain-containing protein [Nitratifractor sp.]
MNDHNLDDLIIGEPDHGGGKSKSFLTLVALLLIILIVGIVLVKLILGGGEEELSEKSSPTELTSVVNPGMEKAEATQKRAHEEPIPEELKPITEERLTPPPVSKPKAQPKPKSAVKKPTASKPTVKKPEAKPTPKPTPKPTAKSQTKPKAERKPTSPSKLFKQKDAAASGKSYYIQVGSFKRPPTQKFLDEMKAKGYEPIIVKSGQMIKVRVGPYGSYGDAKAKLPEIKEKLGISGFVVRKQ